MLRDIWIKIRRWLLLDIRDVRGYRTVHPSTISRSEIAARIEAIRLKIKK